MNEKTKRNFNLLLGPLLLALAVPMFTPTFGREGAYALGTALWMMAWWMTRPVHIVVTAIMPVIINSLFSVTGMSGIISQYSSATVVLLFGSNLLTLPWSTTGLDRRMALKTLSLVGPSVKRQIAVWFTLSVALTSVLPNSVVCTMLTPIAISMLAFIGHKDIRTSELAPPILLSVAWGSCVGGALTPLGGAMNLTAVTYMEEFTGQELMYIDWFKHMFPFVVVIYVVILALFLLTPLKQKTLDGTSEYFKGLYQELGAMTRDEKVCGVLFFTAMVASFLRPLYETILPSFSPTYVFLTLGTLTFFIRKEDGTPLVTWPQAEKSLMWSMLFIFAGGLALGNMITTTGAAAKLAEIISQMSLTGGIGTIAVFVGFTALIAETTSQTAAAAVVVPIVLSTTTTLGLNPVPYIFMCAMAFNTSYILPLGVRAIPVGYGMDTGILIKRGTIFAAFNFVAIVLASYVFLNFWPYFSTLPGM